MRFGVLVEIGRSRDRGSGALEVQICFSIDEKSRFHAQDQPTEKKKRSLRVDGVVGRGSWIVARVEKERKVVGVLYWQPGRMFIGLGVWSADALRIVDNGQG